MPESQEVAIAKLQENMTFMKQEISDIKEIVKGFDTKLDEALRKKADKWVEKVLIWAGVTCGAAILVIIVRFVILYK